MPGPTPDPAATHQERLFPLLSSGGPDTPAGTDREPLIADIALDVPASAGAGRGVFSYGVPDHLASDPGLTVGACVNVTLRGRQERGFVLALGRRPAPGFTLKPIQGLCPGVRLPPGLMALIAWGARYYRCALGEFLAAAVPAPVRDGITPEAIVHVQRLAVDDAVAEALSKRQRQLWTLLPELPTPAAEVEEALGTTRAMLKKLAELGVARLDAVVRDKELRLTARREERFALTAEQQVAVTAVAAAITARRHEPFLLYGVTGSGKTLVYLELAEQVIAQGRQVLLLLPEIGLTPQLAARVRTRFPTVGVWHSAQAAGDRAALWLAAAEGRIPIIVGTRSALFAPLPDIGLIIVDEEHDGSYKQDSVPRYHARDLALVYGKQLGVPVVLGSATPSLESVANGRRDGDRPARFTVLTLKQRPAGAALPDAVLVDMREECQAQKAAATLSRTLVERLAAVKQRGEQAIILLNRRGWSPVVSCKSCGATVMCPNCDIALTWHRNAARLRCHYCGHEKPYPKVCPGCSQDALGQHGLGTEQLADAVAAAVPDLTVLRVDADTVSQAQGHAKLFQAFAEGRADCLVGTQMVAKGLDFPRVTLVGILCADKGLAAPDFRAGERTWQLVAQVAGRAGRGEQPGTVVVQSFDTQALAITCALDHKPRTFIDAELAQRKEYGYPPYAGLIRLLWSGASEANVQLVATEHGQRITPLLDGAVLLGPNPAGIAFLKNQHRWHALLKCSTRGAAQALLDRIEAAGGLPDKLGVRLMIDVDPYVTS